jgi:uncharacterized protein
VKNKSKSAAEVADRHVGLVKATVEAIAALDVPKADIRTSNMQFGEHQVYIRQEYVKDGYVASTDLTVTVCDLTKYIAVWKGVAAIDGASVNSIRFDHSKRIEFVNEARKKAVAVAKTKAAMLAEVYGAKIGAPVSITEEETPASYGPYASNVQSNRIDPAPPEEATGSGGAMQVRARFRVVFDLLP